MRTTINIVILLTLGFFTLLMVQITLPYLDFNDRTAFLRIKQWIIHNQVWKTAFYVHVITSCFCLIAGFTQFSKSLMNARPNIHRYLGWLYVITVLGFSGPSGLIMSVFANGGLISQTAFTTLSVLWIAFTWLALSKARARDFKAHREFMIRSYALTLSAITLRAWKYLIVFFLRPQPMDAYMIVAWLGWVPNLLFAEWYIRKGYKKLKVYF
ncbi:MAG: DUF2306 domain-containing protein [Bacteroidota bacterium]